VLFGAGIACLATVGRRKKILLISRIIGISRQSLTALLFHILNGKTSPYLVTEGVIIKHRILYFTLFVLIITGSALATVQVDNVPALIAAVNATANGGDRTILISDGSYHLAGASLRIVTNGVTVRSASGQRERVVLDGDYKTAEIFNISASNVTIRDIILKRAYYHPVHIVGNNSADITGTVLVNLHIIDPGQQAIKVNPANGHTVNRGLLADSLIELTDSGRAMVWSINGSCYTGCFDAHTAPDWVLRDNTFRGFWCSKGLSEHGIHLWSGSADTLVERNLIIDCDRGIGFGLDQSPHYGGIIRNNFIVQVEGHGQSDVGISLESASGARVYNNTIYLGHAYPNAIEYRFPTAKPLFITNNLSNRKITAREAGSAILDHNLTTARATWFVDTASGNLHLSGKVPGVVNAGVAIDGQNDDIDCEPRPHDGGYDIGANEYRSVVAQ